MAETQARRSHEEKDEVRMAGSSSSPSRHFSSLPASGSRPNSRPSSRRSSKMFGFSLANNHPASEEEEHRSVFINGIESGATSQHVSPWTSRAVSPVSSPGTSVVHGDYGFPQPGRSPADKKRVSWLTSLPASHWTSNRVPHYGEGSSPPTASPRGGKNLNLRTGSSSSSSSSMMRPNFGPRANGGTAGASDADKEVTPASLVPNAQFLGLMLLMILLISSPLIKILSVVLFVGVLVVDSD